MIKKMLIAFVYLRRRQRVKHLPYGMLATRYETDEMSEHIRVAMARYGIRDVAGMRVAMRKRKCKTPEQLIALLEHEHIRRNVLHRLYMSLQRLVTGTRYHPHARDVRALDFDAQSEQNEIKERVKRANSKIAR